MHVITKRRIVEAQAKHRSCSAALQAWYSMKISTSKINKTIKYWKEISLDIHEPQNQDDYAYLVALLDQLLDIVGDNEKHELIGLVDVISHMIAMYDERKIAQLELSSGADVFQFLMEQHGLKQSDFPEVGSQGVVSEILQGKRRLNVRQIKHLANRFHISVASLMG